MLALLPALAALAGAPPPAPAREPPPPIAVEFEDAEYLYKEKRTVMTGSPLVTVTRGDATLVCRRVVAENDERGQIRRATCEGEVKLTRGPRTVTCQNAVFEADAGRVTCRGNPVLRDGGSVLTGEELVYDLDADRISLSRGRGALALEPGKDLPVRKRGGAR